MPKSHQRDFYEVLGVSRTASVEEIKSAYRQAALRWHPDRNPTDKEEAEVKFRECSEAYSVLSDQEKRHIYDTYGHAGLSGAGGGVDFSSTVFRDFHDILGDFFGFDDLFGSGGGRRSRRAQRGADLRYDMTLTFEEAATGVTTKIKLPRQEYCEACNGTGAKKGTGVVTCQSCGGRGQLAYQQGFFTISRTCPACQGAGQIVRERCPECRGQGRVEREKTIELRIPPGVDSGTRLRVAGEGEAAPNNSGTPGDLYVVLEVKEHQFFERRGADLYCTIPLSVTQAALGTELQVPSLNGEEKLKIPEGTQSGAVFRIKGKGLADPRGGGKGDLYYHVRVLTPTKLTREQRKLLEQLSATMKVENKPADRNSTIFDKVKDIFG